MKDTRLNIRISSELKKQAQELAAKDGRTLANWLEQLIRKEIEKAAEK
jgi:predicted HicB family RNase H-like nuclease